MSKNNNHKNPVIGLGIFAGFIASLCCVGPLILIILGVGGASTALAIGKRSPWFLGLGIAILVGGLFYYFGRKKKVCEECNDKIFNWKKIAAIIILSCAVFVIVYYFLVHILVPWLAPIIYKNFYRL